jgi:hypothetical protein
LKTTISTVISITLLIGAPLAYAYTGFTDSQGRPCTFGPSHDECLYQHLEKIPGTSNYADYHSGYKTGLADGLAGDYYHHAKEDNKSASWGDGYYHGWDKGMVQWGKSQGLKDPQENADLLADVNSP